MLVDAPSDRLPCVSYAPFRGSQSPFDAGLVIAPAQIEEDLRALAAVTGCVRIYAVDQGLAAVPAIAQRLGLKVLLGAWLRADPVRNATELATVIDLAIRYPDTIRAVIVGNEVLLRREMPEDRLAAQIRAVAAAVPVPVSYADVWEFWRQHPALADAVDFLTIHILPYWEDDPVGVDAAVDHVREIADMMQTRFPGKPILIGETGWPSRGRMRREALPGAINQARFVREVLRLANAEGLDVNIIEAIDQPWKRRLEGTVGGYWGVLDTTRRPKFPLTGPVRAQPLWPAAFAASAVLTLLPILWAAARRAGLRPPGWLALTIAAAAAGCALVAAALEVQTTSLGLFDWVIGLARLAVAAAALVLTAPLLLAPEARPGDMPLPVATVIDAIRARRWRDVRTAAGGLGLLRLLTLFGVAATSLCLAFDGRYRDFPAAVFAPAVACFVVLGWLGHGGRDRRSRREELLLVAVAAAACAAVLAGEGLGNHQALLWTGVVGASVFAVGLDLRPFTRTPARPAKPELQPDGAQRPEQRRGGAEFGIIEDERGRAGGDGKPGEHPA